MGVIRDYIGAILGLSWGYMGVIRDYIRVILELYWRWGLGFRVSGLVLLDTIHRDR